MVRNQVKNDIREALKEHGRYYIKFPDYPGGGHKANTFRIIAHELQQEIPINIFESRGRHFTSFTIRPKKLK